MQIHVLSVGLLETNCYVLQGEHDCAVIDPGGDPQSILDIAGQSGNPLLSIVLTHGHADHVAGAVQLQRATKAQIWMHPADAQMLKATADAMAAYLGLSEEVPLNHHLTTAVPLTLAGVSFQVLHTPGHTQGSCCLYSQEEKLLISGDTMFAGAVGRSDLEGGNPGQLADSLGMLRALPEDTRVLPGHGEETTIGRERVRKRPW